ncbi:Six-bladed beta-propeller, TolB-like protein [Corchorus olitorius]|uniref:Six-bladed beta-propeller, TolB-like protein n=1 Tax=Corchorus olitorius TaxID=93759 RepID=A0A1R3L366_9ROSI|nr:Six-bladed beta-propeller, TolB-like protein [Corchorus olitorius]
MKTRSIVLNLAAFCTLVVFSLSCTDHEGPAPGTVRREIVAKGLNTPLGLTFDPGGRLFVSEAGSGQFNSQISIIENNQARPVITGLLSAKDGPAFLGITHLLFANDSLYFLHGINGMLYSVKASELNPAQPLGEQKLTSQFLRLLWIA